MGFRTRRGCRSSVDLRERVSRLPSMDTLVTPSTDALVARLRKCLRPGATFDNEWFDAYAALTTLHERLREIEENKEE